MSPSFAFTPHIAVQVADHRAAAAFYSTTMGMEIVERGDGETRLRSGEGTLYLEESTERHVFLAFDVDDLEAAANELEAAGCELTPAGEEGFMVRDPFGLRFYLGTEGR